MLGHLISDAAYDQHASRALTRGLWTPFSDILDSVFMFFADLYFYTKTTDVEVYSQITALSGPRACLGHLNHHAQ